MRYSHQRVAVGGNEGKHDNLNNTYVQYSYATSVLYCMHYCTAQHKHFRVVSHFFDQQTAVSSGRHACDATLTACTTSLSRIHGLIDEDIVEGTYFSDSETFDLLLAATVASRCFLVCLIMMVTW